MNQKETYNFLRPHSFRMIIHNAPTVSFTCQNAELPGMSSSPAVQTTPFVEIPHSFDKLQFDPLNISFIISESLDNYMEIRQWMRAMGFPERYPDFWQMPGLDKSENRKNSQDLMMSDLTLSALDSDNRSLMDVTYLDAFPIALGGITFSTQTQEYNYLVAQSTFIYRDTIISIV